MIHDIFFVPINFSDSLPRVITLSLSSKSLHTTGLGLIRENLAEATMHLHTENHQISDFLLVLFSPARGTLVPNNYLGLMPESHSESPGPINH